MATRDWTSASQPKLEDSCSKLTDLRRGRAVLRSAKLRHQNYFSSEDRSPERNSVATEEESSGLLPFFNSRTYNGISYNDYKRQISVKSDTSEQDSNFFALPDASGHQNALLYLNENDFRLRERTSTL